MNDVLQKHGCSNVFSVPEGLKELMSDISREVLREQPKNILDFISNYLSVMMITREHGVMAIKILDDLCDCRPSVSQHLIQLGIEKDQASSIAEIIKEEIESLQTSDGKVSIQESEIVKRILRKSALDESTIAKVCQVARNAYRDYCYRKMTLEKSLKMRPDEPWEIAAQRTLEIYKRTKPSMSELNRATQKIQAAYRGYHVRRSLLRHLKPKPKKRGPKVDISGPPLDIAGSREFDLGPLLSINIQADDINAMFEENATEKLGLQYDPMKTITHQPDEDYEEIMDFPGMKDRLSRFSDVNPPSPKSRISNARQSRMVSVFSPPPSPINQDDIDTQKISFSEESPEVIPEEAKEDTEDVQEIKEVMTAEEAAEIEDRVDEVPEDIAVSEDEGSAPATVQDTEEEGLQPDTEVEDGLQPDTEEEEGIQPDTEEEEG